MPSWEQVKANESFYAKALSDEEGRAMRWHTYADRPNSSQAICVSAFGTLRNLEHRDSICERFLSPVLSTPSSASESRWEIELEKEQRELLDERGTNQPTSIDAMLSNKEYVVCVEAKFLVDARHGFGGCGQIKEKSCGGFYGPGSDLKTQKEAWCRLQEWDGERSPRLYWSLGAEYFQSHVFNQQKIGEHCVFKGPNYQLMRNFLFAAAAAKKNGRAAFGLILVCPKLASNVVQLQVEAFRNTILRPEFRARVCVRYYEDFVACLKDSGTSDAKDLADFFDRRLDLVCHSLPIRAKRSIQSGEERSHSEEAAMPLYQYRRGKSYGAVVHGAGIVPGRFVYLTKTIGEQNSWRIRDYVANKLLSSSDCPDLSLDTIESLVQHDEEDVPPFDAKQKAEWCSRLSSLSRDRLPNWSATSQPVLEPKLWQTL